MQCRMLGSMCCVSQAFWAEGMGRRAFLLAGSAFG